MRHVILCTEEGDPLGTASVEEAHAREGKLHRALSVFIFRNDGLELLTQKRHRDKLFGGLWANTCCSHPQEVEEITEAAQRRLEEECGFTCPLQEVASFVYRAPDPKGKGSEYEYDTILVGNASPNINLTPNLSEVSELRWTSLEHLIKDIAAHPTTYAPWFPIALHAIVRNIHDS